MAVEKVIESEIVNVVDVIGDVVEFVRAEYDTDNNEKPFYLHGHPLEIVNILKERSESGTLKFKKYPLVVLLEDFEDDGPSGVFANRAKVDILFITSSNKDYTASDRYTHSFDAVLTPIYDLFVKHMLRKTGVHVDHRKLSGKVINHLYWGKKGLYGNEGNQFDDFIDCKEIKGLDLKIYR